MYFGQIQNDRSATCSPAVPPSNDFSADGCIVAAGSSGPPSARRLLTCNNHRYLRHFDAKNEGGRDCMRGSGK